MFYSNGTYSRNVAIAIIPNEMANALTEPLVRYPLFSSTAPNTLSTWQPRNPMTAIVIEAEIPQTKLSDKESILTINQAQKVKTEIISEPNAAAFCPLGEYPPLIPC